MNAKTLYDDAKYDKWYQDYIASKPKTFEEMAKKRMRRNQRARVRARIRRQKAERKRNELISAGGESD